VRAGRRVLFYGDVNRKMNRQTEIAYKYKARDDFYPCGRCPKEKECEEPCELFKIADKEYRENKAGNSI
jgi:hypothetical protein